MTWFDLLILVVLVVSTVSAFARGFLLEVLSLVGLVAGLIVAGEEYHPVAQWLEGWAGSWTASTATRRDATELAAFLLLALGVMLAATLLGRLLRGTARQIGLGFLDRTLGAGLGFVKGCAVIVLVVMAIAAFLPQSGCLKQSRLAPYFLEAAHQASHVTRADLGGKIRQGIELLHPAAGR